MRKIDKIIYLEVIAPTLLTCFTLTFLILGREIGNLSSLLISQSTSFYQLLEIVLCILPGILLFTLPLSLLAGSLIGLSRLSADNEIVAIRAGGVNLVSLLGPLQIIASTVCLMTFFISLYFYPLANDRLRLLKHELATRVISLELHPRVFVEDFPNLLIYVDDIDERHTNLKGVFLVNMESSSEPSLIIAKSGRLVIDEKENRLQLHLEDGQIYQLLGSGDGRKESVSHFATSDFPIPAKDSSGGLRPRNQYEKSTTQLLEDIRKESRDTVMVSELELQKRLALPMACLIFSLLTLPLSVTAGRSGRSAGFVLSILLVLVYYNLFLIGLRMASVGQIPPVLGAWSANLVMAFIALSAVLTINRNLAWKYKFAHLAGAFSPLTRAFGLLFFHIRRRLVPERFRSNPHRTRFRLARIIDSYISRGVLVHFLLTLFACSSLFIILTLFDLTDDIAKNKIPWVIVFNYLWFLTPQIVAFILPIATLVSILIHYSSLEKSRQVVAFKAGGVSQFRLAVPALVLAGLFSMTNYALQENVLPHYNQRQDSLRSIIKGRPKTARPERKWILGKKNKIYNYQYFNSTMNVFSGLTIYDWDRSTYVLSHRLSAQRAKWEGGSRWSLFSGWERDYQGQSSRFSEFSKEPKVIELPEEPDYFRSEIFDPKESSKLSYAELSTHIEILEKSGYDVMELKVALYKKVAFPMACFVMALLAIPFSFSLGRKGALGGITISLLLGIVYWATLSVFEASGNYGLLSPMLAAWAPNVLFGFGGLYFFLGMKT